MKIQTSAQTALYWSRHGESDDTKSFGADPSIGSFTIETEENELAEYGTREVVDREITNVTGSVSVTATATHWWHLETWFESFGSPTDNNDGTYTWETDGSESYDYIDLTIANTRSGEDYLLKKCGVDMTVSMSSPYGGGDNNIELSFEIDVANVEKIIPSPQDTEPDQRFTDADPLYFKNSYLSLPTGVEQTWILTELEFSVTNNDEAITQIPVNDGSTTQGGIQAVTRAAGGRDLTLDRTILRTSDFDEEMERILTSGVPDGQVEEYDLKVIVGNDIVNGEVETVNDIHHIEFSFKNLFPSEFSLSGFDERGGDISQEISEMPTTMTVSYTNGTNTRP